MEVERPVFVFLSELRQMGTNRRVFRAKTGDAAFKI
jgi:hypothetical protein